METLKSLLYFNNTVFSKKSSAILIFTVMELSLPEFNCSTITRSFKSGHITHSFKSGHITHSFDSGHITHSFDSGHITHSFDSDHITHSFDSGHIMSKTLSCTFSEVLFIAISCGLSLYFRSFWR